MDNDLFIIYFLYVFLILYVYRITSWAKPNGIINVFICSLQKNRLFFIVIIECLFVFKKCILIFFSML